LLAQLVGVAPQLLLHSQRSVERALRVVFMSDWCAEQGEDAVASGLGDVTAVALHRLHHQLQFRVDDGAGFLRVEVLDQVIEPLMSAESAVTRLAFALEIFRGGPLRYANLSLVGFACYVRRCCY
jgi:hypothetical protein